MAEGKTLVDVVTLGLRLQEPGCVLLDCRFDLARPDWGAQSFAAGHIPGAQYAHLDRDLSSPVTPTSGRHPLPAPEDLARRAGAWGIDERSEVVVYDQGNGMYAARAWWLLRWIGVEKVALLDGGLAAWVASGRALETAATSPPPRTCVARPAADWVVGATALARELAAGSVRLVDARGADRFAGQNETLDPVAGHVPGAVNHPFNRNLGADGRLLPPETLRDAWSATLGAHAPRDVVAMCGSGVSACLNLLAMEHAGLRGARLYAGSWSEWIRDPSRPVTTGAD
jgi:thiosulfate/3-mercaptopyruvate sulfurtransferase